MADIPENGEGSQAEYNELLDELIKDGVIDAGTQIAREGMPLINFGEQRTTNAALLASVPGINHYYGKGEKEKGLVLDLMARTNFRSRKEILYFLDWVDWCEEFGVGFDACHRYLVAINSEGGKAREQYADAITTMRLRSYGSYKGNNKQGVKPQEGSLS